MDLLGQEIYNKTLTDSEKQEIRYLLWDYRDELLKKEVK